MVTRKIAYVSSTTAELWGTCGRDTAEKELDFYIDQFESKRPLQGTTLEVGCGTGRLLLPLLKKGYRGIGIDTDKVSTERLHERAVRQGLKPDIRLIQFEDLLAPEGLDGIVAFHTIARILKAEALQLFFKKAFDLLLPGGLLLLSYSNMFEYWRPKQWIQTSVHHLDGGFGRIEQTCTPVDYLNGIADIQDYSTVGKCGSAHFDYNTNQVRFYTMSELSLLLEGTGFTDIRTHADLAPTDLEEGNTKGRILYTIARKP